jgi:ribosomal peptide maturation radical SAM protein 1
MRFTDAPHTATCFRRPELKRNDAGIDVRPADVRLLRNAGARPQEPGSSLQAGKDVGPSDAVRNFHVALVNMPFETAVRPTLAIGLLKAIGRRAGFPVDDYLFNLDVAAQLGLRLYHAISRDKVIPGEWFFAVAAFGEGVGRGNDWAASPEAAQIEQRSGATMAYLSELRERIMPEFIEDCLNRIDWGSYGAVGFTSSHQQNVASLALARRIKERYPHVAIIFGGANMDGDMGVGWARAFTYIDYVVSGEGDEVFPELLTRLAEGRSADELLGVVSRCGDDVRFLAPAELVRDLDSLPTPDYDSYYEAMHRYEKEKGMDFRDFEDNGLLFTGMQVQASRGCWWGEKSHCTYCGLNGTSLDYRSKSTERFVAEIEELSQRYGCKG